MPFKTAQNLKNPTPERPKLDFGMIFGPFWLPFFIKNRDTLKTSILRQVWGESSVLARQSLPFWHRFSINFSHVFWSRFWMPFSHPFFEHGAKKWDFGSPFGTQLGPKWDQNLPSGAKNR
jgi:hypothetical protein